VTWGNGTTGVTGKVSAANSLVGGTAQDRIGESAGRLANGNYLVRSRLWDNGPAADAGAVTWGNGTTGVVGTVSSANSLVGSTANDEVGSGNVNILSNDNFTIDSPQWDNGVTVDAGAVTLASGVTGISGIISAQNSAIGAAANAGLQFTGVDNSNQTFFARFRDEGGGTVRVGSQFNGFQPAPTVSLSGTATYTENMAGGLVLSPGASVADTDSADFGGGKLTVAVTANASGADRLFIKSGAPGPGVISVSGSSVFFNTTKIGDFTGNGQGSTPREIALNANATQALVRAISFFVSSESPSTLQRTIEYVLTDSDGFSSNPATKFVNVKSVNDAPVLDTSGNPTLPTILEDATNPSGALVSSLLTGAVTDPDAGALRAARHRRDLGLQL